MLWRSAMDSCRLCKKFQPECQGVKVQGASSVVRHLLNFDISTLFQNSLFHFSCCWLNYLLHHIPI